jgi:small subunit ribosomal protein S16
LKIFTELINGFCFKNKAHFVFYRKPRTFAPTLHTKDVFLHIVNLANTMVRIRLARRGRKKGAMYDIVVADAKAPRDGRFIEKLGTYNPISNPAKVVLNVEKAVKWLLNGAQPTDTTRALLSHEGVMLRKHLQVGVRKGAITQEVADARFEAWKQEKSSRIEVKVDGLNKKQADVKLAKLEAERKVNEARAAAIAQKNTAAVATEEAPAGEAAPAEEAAE